MSISAGQAHTCAILATGVMRCWGRNNFGGLGDGTTTHRLAPVVVLSVSNAVAIGAGSNYTCALLADSTVRCWGSNNRGQLGDGTKTDWHTPVAVSGLTGAVAIAGGSSSVCVLRNDGTVRCWGLNGSGQLGDGTATNRLTPVTVSGLSNAVAISSHGFGSYTCALLADGTGRCWGANFQGQLGDSNFGVEALTPVVVPAMRSPLLPVSFTPVRC